MKQRILVLGSGGMLGHKACELLPKQGFEVFAAFRKIPTTIPPCYQQTAQLLAIDVMEDAALTQAIAAIKPHVIINCVGIVKQLDEAYDRYLSVAINAFLPHRLSRLCQQHQSRLIHISTDCVFSGEKGGYRETDPSDAKDLYGKSKFLGETDASETSALTLRTSIIGHELKSHTHGLLAWMLQQEGKRIKGFKKAIYTGFTTNELVQVISQLIQQHPTLYGTYHLASEPINKYDLLTLINEVYRLNVTIDEDDDFICDRSLDMSQLYQLTGYQSPSWNDMIINMHRSV